MARLVRGTVTENRRLYLLDITLPTGMVVVKIGVASGESSLDRMMQINRSIFQAYRKTAMIGIKRDRPVEEDDVFQYESALHRFFKEYQYEGKKRWDGCTEVFAISLDAAVEAYEYVLDNGVDSLDEFQFDPKVYEKEVDELGF